MPDKKAEQNGSIARVTSAHKPASPVAQKAQSGKGLKDMYHQDVNIKYPEPKQVVQRVAKPLKDTKKGEASTSRPGSAKPASAKPSAHVHSSDEEDSHHTFLASLSSPAVASSHHEASESHWTSNPYMVIFAYVVIFLLFWLIVVTFVHCFIAHMILPFGSKKKR